MDAMCFLRGNIFLIGRIIYIGLRIKSESNRPEGVIIPVKCMITVWYVIFGKEAELFGKSVACYGERQKRALSESLESRRGKRQVQPLPLEAV
jgi:hypothetical protein